jgi:hypothetical protein
MPRPKGRAPIGKKWDDGESRWVEDESYVVPSPKNKANGSSSRPVGRPPLGKKWDDDKEQWVTDESYDAAAAAVAAIAAKAAKKAEQERQANQVTLASSRVGAGSIVRYKPEFFKKHRVLTSNSCRTRGRPPKGMEWDDDQGKWAKQEKQARKRAYLHTARFGDSGKKLLGFWVHKMFAGKISEGEIRSFRVDNCNDLYTIKYEDGNKEDLALEKMIEAHNKATSANNSKTNALKWSNCRPRGRPPKGKTWDVDTAQWVSEEGSSSASASSSAAPPPDQDENQGFGSQESAEAPVYKKRVKKAKLSGGTSRPRGRPPKGKTWDVDTAQWVSEEGSASASATEGQDMGR